MSPISRYLFRLARCFSIPALGLLGVALLLPPTPRESTSLRFAKLDKDQLLSQSQGQRLILVGGSNLTLGIDSQLFVDEWKVQPVNTAIMGSLGLPFMMESIVDAVRAGDYVIVIPEYDQFYGDGAFGSEDLLRVVVDVDRSSGRHLGLRQWKNSLAYLPKFALTKLKPAEYFVKESQDVGYYSRKSFNQFGDVTRERSNAGIPIRPFGPLAGRLNHGVIDAMEDARDRIEAKGARFLVSYPCYHDRSFVLCRAEIQAIEDAFRRSGFEILGSPERYAMPEEWMYDSIYHLLLEGARTRTQRLIEDLKGVPNLTLVPNSSPLASN